jgi:hypothetical protein
LGFWNANGCCSPERRLSAHFAPAIMPRCHLVAVVETWVTADRQQLLDPTPCPASTHLLPPGSRWQPFAWRAVHATRSVAHGRAGGGIVLYWQRRLAAHVRPVECSSNCLVAVTVGPALLPPALGGAPLLLVAAYFPPQTSAQSAADFAAATAQRLASLRELLRQHSHCHFLCMGDFNARIGDHHASPIPPQDASPAPHLLPPSVCGLPRASSDGVTNAVGRQLLGMIEKEGLVVFNGRLGSDGAGQEHEGRFTFFAKGRDARSTVDLVFASPAVADAVLGGPRGFSSRSPRDGLGGFLSDHIMWEVLLRPHARPPVPGDGVGNTRRLRALRPAEHEREGYAGFFTHEAATASVAEAVGSLGGGSLTVDAAHGRLVALVVEGLAAARAGSSAPRTTAFDPRGWWDDDGRRRQRDFLHQLREARALGTEGRARARALRSLWQEYKRQRAADHLEQHAQALVAAYFGRTPRDFWLAFGANARASLPASSLDAWTVHFRGLLGGAGPAVAGFGVWGEEVCGLVHVACQGAGVWLLLMMAMCVLMRLRWLCSGCASMGPGISAA